MKGTPEQPLCGFSAQVVRILNSHGAPRACEIGWIMPVDGGVQNLPPPHSRIHVLRRTHSCFSPPASLPHPLRPTHSSYFAGVTIHGQNVLADSALRVAMKEFSSWPTFPQLYVQGDFVGGCDIVTQLHQSGELKTLLEPLTKQ
jgi:glutaredoxin-related protein